MVHKVLRVGDSAGVTLSRHDLQEMGICIGDKVTISFVPDKKELVIKPFKKQKKAGVSNRIAKLTTNFIDRYRQALEQLA